MANQKVEVLSVGAGSLTSNGGTSRVFSSTSGIGNYSAGTSYGLETCVEYSGRIYKSKIGSNIGNQPDTSPGQWDVVFSSVKDGDVAVIVNGGSSDIQQRANGVWISALGASKVSVPLVDGQLSPVAAVSYVAANFKQARVEYNIIRGSENRVRSGFLIILTDGTSDLNFSNEFGDLGDDVGVELDVQLVAGNVEIQYTSSLLGVTPLTLEYSIRSI